MLSWTNVRNHKVIKGGLKQMPLNPKTKNLLLLPLKIIVLPVAALMNEVADVIERSAKFKRSGRLKEVRQMLKAMPRPQDYPAGDPRGAMAAEQRARLVKRENELERVPKAAETIRKGLHAVRIPVVSNAAKNTRLWFARGFQKLRRRPK